MGRLPEHHPALLPILDAEATLHDVVEWLQVAPVDEVSKRRAMKLLEQTRQHQREAAGLLEGRQGPVAV